MTNGGTTIYDALTQANTLGIFSREGLDFANEWIAPLSTSPVAYSYRLFRNYDGKGSQYGEVWVKSVSSDQTQLAIYGSERLTDLALTMIVINKTANPLNSFVSISNFVSFPNKAKVYSYSGVSLTSIVNQPDITLSKKKFAVQDSLALLPPTRPQSSLFHVLDRSALKRSADFLYADLLSSFPRS